MPRKRKTMSGDPAQKISSVPGQRYGEGVAQQAMQQAMPAPNRAAAPVAPGAAAMPPEAMPPQAAAPVDVQQFLATHNPNLLAGSQMPDQPVTAGLPTGPGPGPEVLGMLKATTPLRRYLEELSAQSGDPTFRRLAERAGL
jgi:hypothetical protein